MEKEPRKTGIDVIGDVPWGTHLCQFYQTKEDLIDILVPYFRAGLENNEFCMWVTSEPLGEEAAKEAMRKAMPDFERFLKRGQIEIVPHTEWYLKDGAFNLQRVLNAWVDKLNQALAKGYDGMRVTGNAAWLEKRDWKSFVEYEEEVNNAIGKYRMLAVCTYSLDKCGASEVIDVVSNHQFALIRRKGEWELIESSERKQKSEVLSEVNARLQVLQQVTAAVHSTLDLEEVFRQITDGAVHSLRYTTVFILTLNDKKKCFEVKALSTRKRLLSQIDKILGFSFRKLSVPADPELNAAVGSVMKGRVVAVKTLADITYPLISKKACLALQKFARTKNYILVPLKIEEGMVGALFISSPREEVSEEELTMVQNFASAASQAIRNANLHTQTKQAEEELRQSEENLRTYLESAPDGVYLNDLKGKFLYGNKKAEEIMGYKREELIGKSFLKLNLLPARDLAKAGKLLALNAIGRPTGPDEFELVRKDGSRICVEINTTPIKQGGEVVVIGFVRDITERKRAEQEMRVKDSAIASSTNAIAIADLEGNLTYVNDSFLRMWGYDDEKEILGKNAVEFWRVAEEAVEVMQVAMDRGGWIGELAAKRKDGSIFDVQLSASVVRNEAGKPICRLGSFVDITERKQAEEREKHLQQELNLASRLASIGEMASGIAHEINNPLTSVIGFSQLLMRQDIPDDIREDLEVINSEAQRVAKIVQGLLTFARQHKPGRDYVDINNLVSQVLELRSHHMEVNNIQVLTQLASDLPRTMADANQLQQVFLNIIMNAEKEMIKAHGRGKLSVKTERIANSIRVSFADDGPGISKENLDRVFNPFFTTREVGDGTGLGLSICHGIITAHNGRTYAKSKLGRGATFVVELPVVAATEQTEETKVIEEEPWQQSGAKILVVDDELAILDFLKRLLTEQGYQVETINRAHLALVKLQSEKYDLILLDIKLPGMSGIDLYYEIKAIDPAMAQQRVMFITGNVMETTTRDFLEETKACHITKPLNIEQLKKNVSDILTRDLMRK